MASWDATMANSILAGAYGVAAFPSVPGTHIRLGTTTPTATANMTELSGTGYTAGGQSISWSTPSSQQMHNTTSPSWTNSGTSPWVLTAVEIWSTSGTPARISFAVWAGAPITVNPGNEFAPAVSALAVSER